MIRLQTQSVRLNQSGDADLDGLRPFDFQTEIETRLTDETTRVIFMSAETGAGKTRAFALPALRQQRNLIIVAPTNALIQDIHRSVIALRDKVHAPHEVHIVTRYALYALRGLLPPNR